MGRLVTVRTRLLLQRNFILPILVIGIVFPLLILSSRYYDQNRPDYVISKQPVNSSKLILLWTPFYDLYEKHPFIEGCPKDDQCQFTHDRRLLNFSHAIVFHCRDIILTDLPPRDPKQVWVFFCLEPPTYSYFLGYRYMLDMFNFTVTYRLDSDVACTYGHFRKLRRTDRAYVSNGDLISNKTKLAYWMVSHCNTNGRREDFVDSLTKYMDVDIFGYCGKAACPRDRNTLCHESFARKYKFVFALENSICKDYISEKLFQAMAQDIIPVVFGGSDYTKVVPPNSVINALSFRSVKALADHLIEVARNETLYRGYLKWKEDYVLDDEHSTRCVCDLCDRITGHNSKVYPDFREWWVSRAQCKKWGSDI